MWMNVEISLIISWPDTEEREIKTPVRFAQANLIAYAFNIGDQLDELTSFQEACQIKDREFWFAAMKEEIASLYKNNT